MTCASRVRARLASATLEPCPHFRGTDALEPAQELVVAVADEEVILTRHVTDRVRDLSRPGPLSLTPRACPSEIPGGPGPPVR